MTICYFPATVRWLAFRRGRKMGMEKKTQLSVILTNRAGELASLCDVLKAEGINILAMSIQNANDAVKELYRMREKTGRRIALAESYRGILKDSSDYSLIRLVVDRPVEAGEVLRGTHYLMDTEEVLVFRLVNQPGMLGRVAKKFGELGINIDYIYGSATEETKKAMFVLHVDEKDFVQVQNGFNDL
jgi:hypothetical protein